MCSSQNGVRSWGNNERKNKCQINIGCLIAKELMTILCTLWLSQKLVLFVRSQSVYAKARKSKSLIIIVVRMIGHKVYARVFQQ